MNSNFFANEWNGKSILGHMVQTNQLNDCKICMNCITLNKTNNINNWWWDYYSVCHNPLNAFHRIRTLWAGITLLTYYRVYAVDAERYFSHIYFRNCGQVMYQFQIPILFIRIQPHKCPLHLYQIKELWSNTNNVPSSRSSSPSLSQVTAISWTCGCMLFPDKTLTDVVPLMTHVYHVQTQVSNYVHRWFIFWTIRWGKPH